jgi:DNA replication protein DnaC
MEVSADPAQRLEALCKALKLSTIETELAPRLLAAGLDEALDVVVEAFELEVADRQQRRVDRLRRASQLAPGKTFDSLELERLPRKLRTQLRDLARGQFVERCANVLAFGLPGAGKTHAMIALGHALVERGIAVYFTPTFKLVQQLLAAKRDLELARLLHKLDRFDVIVLDDLGYVQQSAEDAEVLFTLMAERYERRSLIVTSNLVFSQWDRIFGNPMATAAAIDRVVHHSVILEFDVPSKRAEDAARAARPEQTDTQDQT